MISSIKILGFKAIDYPQLAENICHGHKKRLAEFNIPALISSKDCWLTNTNVYCICAIDEVRDKILGAIRIQIAEAKWPIPLEEAMNQLHVNFHAQINKIRLNENVAESCGLWCAGESVVKKINLPGKLLCFQNVICKYLNIHHCFAFVPNHSLSAVCNAGFRKYEQFPDPFSYPNEKYQTWVLHMTPLELKTDLEELKLQMLVNDPHLVHKSEFENHSVIIKYELLNFDCCFNSNYSSVSSFKNSTALLPILSKHE